MNECSDNNTKWTKVFFARCGRRGGLASAKAMTPAQRRRRAVRAIRARWSRAKAATA